MPSRFRVSWPILREMFDLPEDSDLEDIRLADYPHPEDQLELDVEVPGWPDGEVTPVYERIACGAGDPPAHRHGYRLVEVAPGGPEDTVRSARPGSCGDVDVEALRRALKRAFSVGEVRFKTCALSATVHDEIRSLLGDEYLELA